MKNNNFLLTLFAVFLVSISGQSPARAQQCTAPAAVCSIKSNVVRISSFEPIGSAVILDAGVLITNRHMVADNPDVDLILPDGSKHRASVVPNKFKGDLVLLLVEGAKLPSSISVGEADTSGELYVIGYDVGRDAIRVYAPGQVIVPQADTPYARLHHDARSLHGNSGGALLNAKGQLVGIVASGGEGRNEAIPASALIDLRLDSGPEFLDASLKIGAAYRQCVEGLDRVKQNRAPLEPGDMRELGDICLSTNNRQLIDLAGQALGMHRDIDGALKLLLKSHELDPNAPNSIISLAITYHIAGRYADEIPVLYRGLDLLPKEPQLLRLALQAGIWGKDQALADRAMAQIEKEMPAMAPAARNFYNAAPPAPRLKSPN